MGPREQRVARGALTPTYADMGQVSAAWAANVRAVAREAGSLVRGLGPWLIQVPGFQKAVLPLSAASKAEVSPSHG